MMELLSSAVGFSVLCMHVGIAIFALAYFLDRERFDAWMKMLAPHALAAGALLGIGAVVMSLYYSIIVGFPVCELCWWQRIAIYPIAVFFAVAWWRGDRMIAPFVYTLAVFGVLVAGYHEWLQVGGVSLLPCSADPNAVPCSRVYFKEFGYVTFPVIAMTVLAYEALFAWAAKRDRQG